MRILWLVNISFPAVAEKLGVRAGQGGGWMTSLAEELVTQNPDVELGIAAALAGPHKRVEFTQDRVTYYALVEPGSTHNLRRFGVLSWEPILTDLMRFIDRFAPDVIVVHGTELGYGLLASRTDIPVVVSLQGVLTAYADSFWGELSNPFKRLLYPRSLRSWVLYKLWARNEQHILKSARNFSGRTLWDYAQVLRYRDDFRYFMEPRALRAAFYTKEWKLEDVNRLTILTATTPKFLKGTPTLIRAVGHLRRTFPEVRLSIAGSVPDVDVGTYIRKLIRRLDLEGNVELLGSLDAESLASRLERAHVYALPSHIENSPNSLAEAQVVGTPSVAASVGGVPDMLQHGTTGLQFEAGDPYMLAAAIRQVFENDEFACRLSAAARAEARRRNNRNTIAHAHLAMCEDVARSSTRRTTREPAAEVGI